MKIKQHNKIKHMKVFKTLLLLLITFCTTLTINGQQDPQYTQYLYNLNIVFLGFYNLIFLNA